MRKDKEQQLYPNRVGMPAFSGDYVVIVGVNMMNVIPLSEVDYITFEENKPEAKEPNVQP